MKHLNDVGLSYGQHCRLALACAIKLVLAAMALGIHAVCPFWFERTGSSIVRDVHKVLSNNAHLTHATHCPPQSDSN
jgi:hypothetical protein